MEQKKLFEAKMLVLQACTLLRRYSGLTEAPPASLEELQTCLIQLLPCLSILNSFDSGATSRGCERRARGEVGIKLRAGIYRIVGVALGRIVEFNAAAPPDPVEGTPRPGNGGEGGGKEEEGKGEGAEGPPPPERVSWADVCGCEEAVLALRQTTLLPRRFPGLFAGGRRAWRAVLLFGPPGTGKTLLAQAAAGEWAAPLLRVAPADLLSRWVGESEKAVRAVFARAARAGRCVLFFDEVDALGGVRGGGGESELARRLKTELLLQLQSLPPSVVLLAATNLPWEVDAAILRRFDRLVYVGLPSREARRRVLLRQLDGIHHTLSSAELEEVLDRTAGYSVSDVMHLLSQAMMGAVEDLVDADAYRLATQEDLEEYFTAKASRVRGLDESRATLKSKRQRSQNRSHSDACSSASLCGRSLSTCTSPTTSPSSSTAENVLEGFTSLKRSLEKSKTKSKALLSGDFSMVVLPRSHPPRQAQAAATAYGSVGGLRREAASVAPERHPKPPNTSPPLLRKNKRRKTTHPKTAIKTTINPEAKGSCSTQSDGFANGAADTSMVPAVYYVPCKSSHPSSLQDSPSSFAIPPERLILPPVRFKDILKAMKSFIPSVTAEDLKRFEAWRTRHGSSMSS